ncbi:hypothetical protein BKA70DRAFT_1438688 [Coprinopsis sp. MPI-PUGE-AT-0042]|nr:hypothetical protein BKA70DRAFT_1438688 [Coprinopsis sp. MPI-PUGE-AT-0042]
MTFPSFSAHAPNASWSPALEHPVQLHHLRELRVSTTFRPDGSKSGGPRSGSGIPDLDSTFTQPLAAFVNEKLDSNINADATAVPVNRQRWPRDQLRRRTGIVFVRKHYTIEERSLYAPDNLSGMKALLEQSVLTYLPLPAELPLSDRGKPSIGYGRSRPGVVYDDDIYVISALRLPNDVKQLISVID